MEISEGGGSKAQVPSVSGVWKFSGTTQFITPYLNTIRIFQNVQEYVCDSVRHANVFVCLKKNIHVAGPRLRIQPDMLYITSDSVP